MRFRHLDYGPATDVLSLGPAAIDDILDRGDLDAWAPLARAIRADPHGELADLVLRLCEAHPMYGTAAMWGAWIARLRYAPEDHSSLSLAQARIRAGLTQHDVAVRMGISQSDVSKLERRRDLRLSTLREYAAALDATLHIVARTPEGVETTLQVGDSRPQGRDRAGRALDRNDR
jgi:DNA-binding XRE family transcriptional regulator